MTEEILSLCGISTLTRGGLGLKDFHLFTGVFGKLRASSDYNNRDQTINLKTCCAKVLIEKRVFDRKKAAKCT